MVEALAADQQYGHDGLWAGDCDSAHNDDGAVSPALKASFGRSYAVHRDLLQDAPGRSPRRMFCFSILTSHGSRAGLAVKAGRLTETLTPSRLANMLARTGVQHKVVIISACYSGIFIPPLANPNLLVITAADANHPSFGCRDKAKWTYFGNAFFNIALRQAKSVKNAFVVARALVRKRELREHFEPSNPLMAGGANVHSLLIVRP